MLLPPGEAVGLSGLAGDPTDLATALVRHTGAAAETSAAALRDAVDQLEARLAITGEARLDGVGVFQRTSGGVRFAPDPDLLAAVNRPFEGLVPVAATFPAGGDDERGGPTSADVEAPSAVAVAPAPPVAVVPDEPPGALDILLDLIVNEPAETPDEASPSAPSPDALDIETDGPEAPEAEAPAEEGRGDVSPMESAFVDDDTLDDDLDTVLAVPFGLSDEAPDLRDVLPPTPPDRDPGIAPEPDAAEPDAEGPSDWPTETWTPRDEAPRPLDFADDDVEDADFLVVPPPPPSDDLPDDPPPLLDEEPPDVEAGAETAYRATPDVVLGAFGASVSAGAEPPHTASPEEPPRAYVNAGPVPEPVPVDVDTERPARRGWAFLLLALALAALFLWRLLRADDPAPAPAAPSGAAVAASEPDADTLAGRLAVADSAAAEPARPDTLVPPPAPDAVAASQDATPATPSADAPAPGATPGPAQVPPQQAAGGRRLGVAPDPRLALLPARVAGLLEADVRALTGGAVSVAAGPWTWVVLSTPSRAEADGLAERYRTAGYRTGVLQASRNGRPSFRVVVGAFASREQAIRLRDRLPPQAPPDTWALDLRSS